MSSKLMPPNPVEINAAASTTLSGSLELISMSTASTSPKRLNKTALPSITGFDAKAPMSPSPKTAVPFEITATVLPLSV